MPRTSSSGAFRTPHVWILPGLGLIALAGLAWVRGRNFVSLGTDWRVVLIASVAIASLVVASSPFRQHRSISAFVLYVAFLSTIGFVTFPAAYTAAFGSPISRSYIVSEKVQVRGGGCSRTIELVAFQGRLDNKVCVSEHVYQESSAGTRLVVTGSESRFGIWLEAIAK